MSVKKTLGYMYNKKLLMANSLQRPFMYYCPWSISASVCVVTRGYSAYRLHPQYRIVKGKSRAVCWADYLILKDILWRYHGYQTLALVHKFL